MSDKLLLADDSITIQKVVGIIFANEDYTLTVVDNGSAALEKAREIVPDIILADVVMPGKTGYEVCAEVRRTPVLRHVPVLLLSGAFEPFDEGKARECGADDFISKPFESQQLIEKVKRLLELGKERKGAALFAAPSPAAPVAGEMGDMFFEVQEIGKETELPVEELYTTEEIVDARPEDDLWGTFELEEVAEDEAAEFETLLEDEAVEPFGELETEEEYSFAFAEEEEPPLLETGLETTGVPPLEAGAVWEPVGEETFVFEQTAGAGEFELVVEEEPFGIEIEEEPSPVEPAMGGVFEFEAEAAEPSPFVAGFAGERPAAAPAMPEVELQFAPEEEYVPASAAGEPLSMGEVFEFEAEAEEPSPFASGFAGEPPLAATGGPVDELQFAPEEEYVPVAAAVAPVVAAAPVAAQPAAYGELTLSEAQLASIVAKISRDIIERIAWEVVPDLAETLIREEIRKIKEGQ